MMKIAVPVANGKLTAHFGHCAGFDAYEIADDGKTVGAKSYITAPPHEPGLLPRFLGEQGISHIIAGGMGQRARDLFAGRGIVVCVGAPARETGELVREDLDGTLVTGTNACDH